MILTVVSAVLSLFFVLAAAAPSHIVSLNLCTDELLVLLAPERVAALTPLARDPSLSVVAEQAAHFPWVRPAAESVLALHPDLVLAAPYAATRTAALVAAAGVPVRTITLPADFDGIDAETRRFGDFLGVPGRADAALAAMHATLDAVHPDHGARALVWEPQGWSAGQGGLWGSVLRRAGLTDIGDGTVWGLERVLARRPDLIITAPSAPTPALGTALLRHPAVAAIPRREIPAALTLCPGPWSAEAVRLAAGT